MQRLNYVDLIKSFELYQLVVQLVWYYFINCSSLLNSLNIVSRLHCLLLKACLQNQGSFGMKHVTLKQLNLCKTATLKKNKNWFSRPHRLMQVKSIAECSKGSILQYFRPSLSYQLLLRSLFCLFLSGRFTQVLLYY